MTTTARPTLTRRQVLDLARAAHRAPSIHNSQPWRLRARSDGLEIDEDPSRALDGVDPTGRERIISCGAAVENAEVAVARLGWTPEVELLPDGAGGTRLAVVHAGRPTPPTAEADELYRAVWERRTHRRIFMTGGSVDPWLPGLQAAALGHGARLAVLPHARRAEFAQLLWAAAQSQVHDEAVRADLEAWTGPGRGDDGIPSQSQATAPFPVDGLLSRSRPVGEVAPPWVVEDLAQGTVVMLLTVRDDRLHWLQAGRALEAVLLRATADGLVASFLNQAVQQSRFRPDVAAVFGATGVPQVVLRIGEPLVAVPATPRRPLGDVLEG